MLDRSRPPADLDVIAGMAANPEVTRLRRALFEKSCDFRYSYHFSWLGRPVIQYPEDLMAMQEIIWEVRPDVIVETGIAHGGSLLFYATMLAMLGDGGRIVGVDIDIRAENRAAIEAHPMCQSVTMIEGSSISETVARSVAANISPGDRVLLVLDSNHSHEHVSEELRLYAPLISEGSYGVVFDTVIEELPTGSFPDRPWDRGSNPLTAVQEFLAANPDFEAATEISDKLLLSAARGGYLRRKRS